MLEIIRSFSKNGHYAWLKSDDSASKLNIEAGNFAEVFRGLIW